MNPERIFFPGLTARGYMNKLLILLVSIIISLIVWAIGYHFFYFGFGRPIHSLAVSILAGVIVWSVLSLIGKSWGHTAQVVAVIFLTAVAVHVTQRYLFACPNYVRATVYCNGSNEYVSPDPICVAFNGTVDWYFGSTQVIPIDVTFDKGFQPFAERTFRGTSASPQLNKIAIHSGDGYYSFTCNYATGPRKVDPMIHVPK
jgi:hypothetical protein